MHWGIEVAISQQSQPSSWSWKSESESDNILLGTDNVLKVEPVKLYSVGEKVLWNEFEEILERSSCEGRTSGKSWKEHWDNFCVQPHIGVILYNCFYFLCTKYLSL